MRQAESRAKAADREWMWNFVERGLLILAIVMFFVTHIAASVIGEDYELSTWLEFPRLDTKTPQLPHQPMIVTLHVLNSGKVAIGNERSRWILAVAPSPGTVMQ